MVSSRLTISRTQICSAAARIIPAPNDLAYQKYDTQTTQKGYPRGVQFYPGLISSRERSLRRRTLQDLIVHPSSVTLCRSSLGLSWGYFFAFFISLESLHVVGLREF